MLCSSLSTAISKVNMMIQNLRESDKIPAEKYYSKEKCIKKPSHKSRRVPIKH